MNRRRDIIISKILDICIQATNKTKIVYQANLNFKTVDRYIEFLSDNGMINTRADGKQVLYKTTNKGLALLDNYRQIQEELS